MSNDPPDEWTTYTHLAVRGAILGVVFGLLAWVMLLMIVWAILCLIEGTD